MIIPAKRQGELIKVVCDSCERLFIETNDQENAEFWNGSAVLTDGWERTSGKNLLLCRPCIMEGTYGKP